MTVAPPLPPNSEPSPATAATTPPNLGKAAAKGALALAIGRPITASLTFLGTLVLARLVSPTEFGLVGMVLVFTRFAEVFRELGLGAVAIQREHLDQQQLSTLFWVNTGVSAAIGLLFIACGPLLAWFYGEPRVAGLAVCSGVAFAMSGASVQHQSALRRAFRVKALMVVQNAALALGLISAVIFAWRGGGAYALLTRNIVEAAFALVGYWLVSGFTPGRPGRLDTLASELRFGANLTLANLLNYFSRQGDNLIIGKFFGPQALGLYAKAYELMLIPLNQVTRPLVAIAIPALSRLQSQPEAYSRAYFRIADKALLITTPIGALCLGCPELLIRVALGPRWAEAAPIARALSLVMFAQPLANTAAWLLPSQDRSAEMLRLNVASALVNVLCFLVGATQGSVGIAWAYSIGQMLIIPAMLWYICRRGPIRQRDIQERFVAHVLGGLLGAATAYWLSGALQSPPTVVRLGASGMLAGSVVWLTLYAFPWGRAAIRDIRVAAKLMR